MDSYLGYLHFGTLSLYPSELFDTPIPNYFIWHFDTTQFTTFLTLIAKVFFRHFDTQEFTHLLILSPEVYTFLTLGNQSS